MSADGNLANIKAGDQHATFEVKITDSNDCSNTTIIDRYIYSVNNPTKFFEILPNPTCGNLKINYTSEFDATSKVTIYDVLGRKLHTWKFEAGI